MDPAEACAHDVEASKKACATNMGNALCYLVAKLFQVHVMQVKKIHGIDHLTNCLFGCYSCGGLQKAEHSIDGHESALH
jgi:hypothetical protein